MALALRETAEGTRELLSLEAENWAGRRVVFSLPVKDPEARSGRPRVVEMPPGLLPSFGLTMGPSIKASVATMMRLGVVMTEPGRSSCATRVASRRI